MFSNIPKATLPSRPGIKRRLWDENIHENQRSIAIPSDWTSSEVLKLNSVSFANSDNEVSVKSDDALEAIRIFRYFLRFFDLGSVKGFGWMSGFFRQNCFPVFYFQCKLPKLQAGGSLRFVAGGHQGSAPRHMVGHVLNKYSCVESPGLQKVTAQGYSRSIYPVPDP